MLYTYEAFFIAVIIKSTLYTERTVFAKIFKNLARYRSENNFIRLNFITIFTVTRINIQTSRDILEIMLLSKYNFWSTKLMTF